MHSQIYTPSEFCSEITTPTHVRSLSLHDALPISGRHAGRHRAQPARRAEPDEHRTDPRDPPWLEDLSDVQDRKSTRLNSSHVEISYAVFCLKKNKDVTTSNLLKIVYSIEFIIIGG